MKILLSIDTEADFWKYIQAPFGSLSKVYKIKWHINRILGRLRYASGRKGVINLVNFLKKNQIPATFNITGHLYLKQCDGWPHFKERKPTARWFFKRDWYYWDKGGDFRSKPGLYLGDFIEKEMKKEPLFALGIHGFAHECLPLENGAVSDSIIKASVAAARAIGVMPVSCSAPFNITENPQNSSLLYNSLRKAGIKIVRYMGYDNYPDDFHHTYKAGPPLKKKGLIFVHGSNYFEGSSGKKHLQDILRDMEKYLDKKDFIYCLCCHDFTFRNIENLKFIFSPILKWKERGKIEFVTMKQIVDKT